MRRPTFVLLLLVAMVTYLFVLETVCTDDTIRIFPHRYHIHYTLLISHEVVALMVLLFLSYIQLQCDKLNQGSRVCCQIKKNSLFIQDKQCEGSCLYTVYSMRSLLLNYVKSTSNKLYNVNSQLWYVMLKNIHHGCINYAYKQWGKSPILRYLLH